MSKCANCGKEDASIEFEAYTWHGGSKKNVKFICCSEECKREAEQFITYVNKNVRKFITLIIIGTLSFIPFIILYSIYKNDIFGVFSAVAPLAIIGLAIYKYPFSTPQTNSVLGLKKASRTVKVIGLSLIAAGIIILSIYLILS